MIKLNIMISASVEVLEKPFATIVFDCFGASLFSKIASVSFVQLFCEWCARDKIVHQILVENPERLYGFSQVTG